MRRTPATIALVLANVLAYVWEVTSGTNFDSNQSLLAHGALYGPLVQQGQWWRVISGAFLHAGLAHIALNMIALYQLGMVVELLMGSSRMLGVYAIALFGGGYAVVYFAPGDVTVGASGAIFGLFGALIAIGVRLGQRGRALISQVFLAGLVLFATKPQPPVPVVVDAATGEQAEAELLPPEGAA